jgi:hypothetical protein
VRLQHLILALAGLGGALALVTAACGGEETAPPQATLCEPGENIFCRCPGGDAGTKRCNDDGDGFGECDFCEGRDGFGGGTGEGPGGFGGDQPGEGGGSATGLELLRPCIDGSECDSGTCENNYCTLPCERPSDCPYPESECVPWAGDAICMPVCTSAGECEVYGAPPSLCGYAPAVDNWSVTVCANWGDEHELLPEGTDCAPLDHQTCNLGYAKREVVCSAEGVCAPGCYSESDCSDDRDCSSTGDELGDCR